MDNKKVSSEKEKFSFLEPLAKELGYKDVKEMRDALGKEEAGRGGKREAGFGNISGPGGVGTGFLGGREVGSGLGVGIKSRLAKGASVKEALAGGIADFRETFSVENIKRRSFEKTFSGPGFISAFARGKLKKKYAEKSEKKSKKTSLTDTISPEKVSDTNTESLQQLSSISQQSEAFSGIAQDVAAMRENLQELVKIWGGKPGKTKEKKTLSSSKSLPANEIKKISDEVDAKQKSEQERQKDVDFFAEQDKIEAEQEASRLQDKEKTTTPTPEKKKEEGGSLLDTILSFFSSNFLSAITSLFSPKMLMKFFSKIFLPAVIIGTLFSGIVDGFKKYKETGSFSEAIISGLGGMLSFLTFGIFGEDTIRNLFDSISNFLKPITDTISEIFTGIKNFFIGLFGGQVKVEDKTPAKAADVTPSDSKIKDYAMKPAAGGKPGEGGEAGKAGKPGEGGEAGVPGKTEKETKVESETTTPTPVTPKVEEKQTTPAPAPATVEEAKTVEKISGTKLKLPPGVKYDKLTDSMIYKGIYFTAHDQEDLNKMVKAIDDKAIIEFQGKDASGKSVTIKFDGSTGSQTISAAKPQTAPTPASESGSTTSSDLNVSVSGAGGGGGGGEASGDGVSGTGGGEISAAGPSSGGSAATPSSGESGTVSEVGSEPTQISTPPSVPSGEQMSATSSEVSEGQRMESAADQGATINSPTTNNETSSSGKGPKKSADVYDSDLASMLVTT